MGDFRRALAAAAALAGLCTSQAALADGWDLTGGLSLQSDYRFRGISQNDRQPTPEATLNLLAPDGWYAGTWWAMTDWGIARPGGGSDNPAVEADFYAGKNTDLWGTNLNVEAYYYAYPDFSAGGGPRASFFETITQLSRTFGPLAATATWAWSPQFSLGGGTGNYVGGGLSLPINDWVTLSANLGHQWVQAAKVALGRGGDYTHGDIGATVTYRALSLDLRYVTTDAGKTVCGFYMATANACAGGFTGMLSYTFTAASW
ncbi:MAG: hypothetical protein H6924_11200 [Alphaproteobacteria bacterium]|nr:hypothetical protein [Alphaproteobacteria bacterium]